MNVVNVYVADDTLAVYRIAFHNHVNGQPLLCVRRRNDRDSGAPLAIYGRKARELIAKARAEAPEPAPVSRGGRPKRSQPRASIALRLEPALLERIDDFAFMREAPRNAAIVALIEAGLALLVKDATA